MHEEDKTQCQLCKRLTGPIFPLSCSNMVRKRVSPMDVVARGQLTAILLCVRSFSAWWHPNKQQGDPSASLLLTSEKVVFCKIWNWFSSCIHVSFFCNLWTAPRVLYQMELTFHEVYISHQIKTKPWILNKTWITVDLPVWPYLAEIAKSGRFQHRTSTNTWTWEITTFVEIQMEVATH